MFCRSQGISDRRASRKKRDGDWRRLSAADRNGSARRDAPAKDSDLHLESDIRAAKDNKNGFAQGDWIPYLAVAYELTKLDGNETRKGEFMPMVANDGPHYGVNVKMMGPGKYRLTLTIAPPNESKHTHFGRHVDKETGVAPWFKTFAVEYEFVYAGIGKKGAY